MNMQFDMPVVLVGAMSFQPDSGNRINQLYTLNQDPTNPMYRGMVPAKMSCEQSVFEGLSQNPEDFPVTVTLTVVNKTAGGKTVQHAMAIKPAPKNK